MRSRSLRALSSALLAALAAQQLPDVVHGRLTRRLDTQKFQGRKGSKEKKIIKVEKNKEKKATKNRAGDDNSIVFGSTPTEAVISFGVEMTISNIRCDQVAQCIDAVSGLDSRTGRRNANSGEDESANRVLELSMCRALEAASAAYGTFSGPIFTDCAATGATLVTSCPQSRIDDDGMTKHDKLRASKEHGHKDRSLQQQVMGDLTMAGEITAVPVGDQAFAVLGEALAQPAAYMLPAIIATLPVSPVVAGDNPSISAEVGTEGAVVVVGGEPVQIVLRENIVSQLIVNAPGAPAAPASGGGFVTFSGGGGGGGGGFVSFGGGGGGGVAAVEGVAAAPPPQQQVAQPHLPPRVFPRPLPPVKSPLLRRLPPQVPRRHRA